MNKNITTLLEQANQLETLIDNLKDERDFILSSLDYEIKKEMITMLSSKQFTNETDIENWLNDYCEKYDFYFYSLPNLDKIIFVVSLYRETVQVTFVDLDTNPKLKNIQEGRWNI